MSCDALAVNTAIQITGPTSLGINASNQLVQRNGSNLLLQDGTHFRVAGPNIYWLGLDENINADGSPSYPSQQRVLEIMATAATMGATTIRSHTLGISIGCDLCILRGNGTFNQQALRVVDFGTRSLLKYAVAHSKLKPFTLLDYTTSSSLFR